MVYILARNELTNCKMYFMASTQLYHDSEWICSDTEIIVPGWTLIYRQRIFAPDCICLWLSPALNQCGDWEQLETGDLFHLQLSEVADCEHCCFSDSKLKLAPHQHHRPTEIKAKVKVSYHQQSISKQKPWFWEGCKSFLYHSVADM